MLLACILMALALSLPAAAPAFQANLESAAPMTEAASDSARAWMAPAAAAAGLAGLVLMWLPYVSLLGLILLLTGLASGIWLRRKGHKNLYTRLAVLSGILGLIGFLGVAGLLLFF